MGKQIIAGAAFENEKFYFEQEFNDIPDSIKDEIKIICVTIAFKLECTFLIGFHEDGDVFFEIIKPEDAIDFDDIGAELEVKEVKRQKSELLKALSMWYKVFRTSDGEQLKKQLIKNRTIDLQ